MSTLEGMWIAFFVFIALMLVLDLGVFHRHSHEIGLKEALGWCAFWIALAMIFNIVVYYFFGREKAVLFLTGYLVEESLSIDNMFVFVLIFTYFSVPAKYQHKVLFWGILGALVMRAIFIFAGITLINRLHWIIYIFGIFLIYTGFKLAFSKNEKVNVKDNAAIRLVRKLFPVTGEYHGGKFFVKLNDVKYITPLFLVLVLIETTDLIFAVDSIPAVLGITHDPFIVYTSNVFAILGLRAIYFALAGTMKYFRFLQYGLAVVLTFVGVKMTISKFYAINSVVALLVILVILLCSVLTSLVIKPRATKND
jgi:tellurite resistance protein TerC